MTRHIKRVLLRTDSVHQTYNVKYDNPFRAGSFYLLPYASPSSAYLASAHYPERTLARTDRSTRSGTQLQLSNIDGILAELKVKLSQPGSNIAELLAGEFVISKVGGETDSTRCDLDSDYEYRTHTSYFQKYEVMPMMEALLMHKANECKALLAQADVLEENRKQFVEAMRHIQLAENEAIDFSGFNLTGASFAGAKLGCSVFDDASVTSGANFDECDLTKTNITQAHLDAAASYKDAKLKDGMWVYWDQDIKAGMLQRIGQMEEYVDNDIPKNSSKYTEAKLLCEQYKPLLNGNAPISAAKKAEILNAFVEKGNSQTLNEYRNVKSRAAEVAAFVAGLVTGVGLLVWGTALCIQRYRNGYWGLFHKPKTAALAHKVARHVPTMVGSR